VGAHLLAALLGAGKSRFVALVRESSDQRAWSKCRAALAEYGLWSESFTPRLSVLAGDFSKPSCGLRPAIWDSMTQCIDSIVHCGAVVDFLRPYAQLRPHNVVGTLEMIKLGTTNTRKHLHFVSTLSVFGAEAIPAKGAALIPESTIPQAGAIVGDAYSQSKAVAENLLAVTRTAGLPVSIYRLGEVGPSTGNGMANRKCALYLLLKACASLGMYPNLPFDFECTAVDAVANVLKTCILNGNAAGETYHIFQDSPISFLEVMERIGRRGDPMRPVDYREFLTTLDRSCQDDSAAPELRRLRAVLGGRDGCSDLPSRLPDAGALYARERFDTFLSNRKPHFPSLTEEALAQMATQGLDGTTRRSFDFSGGTHEDSSGNGSNRWNWPRVGAAAARTRI
jgi:thioester reductase-like protein